MKKGKWVASEAFDPEYPGCWESAVYERAAGDDGDMVFNVRANTRAKCREAAAAIRDLANKKGW